ncbi:hypothetical protein [Rhizobium leguminosarum]|uniref:hypothetical protein n=1 Tax=Rhizobium leguminosarum TaxID=384 RepID=UPI003F997B28
MCRGFKSLLRYHLYHRQICIDQARQVAFDANFINLSVFSGIDHDGGHELPKRAEQFRRRLFFALREYRRQILDVLSKTADGLRLKLNHIGWLFDAFQQYLLLVALLTQWPEQLAGLIFFDQSF